MFHSLTERANIAANALVVQQAAAARLLMSAQALAECREQTNPYLPGNMGLLGPTRQQMWGPDPCATQEKDLADATAQNVAAQQAAQIQNAPNMQDLQVAPAPQLVQTYDPLDPLRPDIPETEMIVPSPQMSMTWSPTSLLEVMDALAAEMEARSPANSLTSEDLEELFRIHMNLIALCHWDCGYPTHKRKKRYQYLPDNQDWIGKWLP